jgi:hypothetical protein
MQTFVFGFMQLTGFITKVFIHISVLQQIAKRGLQPLLVARNTLPLCYLCKKWQGTVFIKAEFKKILQRPLSPLLLD